jgi:hypothetical protein
VTTQKTVSTCVEGLLNESVMGFLALLALFLGLAPSAFVIHPHVETLSLWAEMTIAALFAIEYMAGHAQAPCKTEFVRNAWRLLDALIVIAALISLLPIVHPALRSSPALRLVRLSRLALFGTRSSAALAQPAVPAAT